MKRFISIIIVASFTVATNISSALAGEFAGAWNSKNSSIVLDAYEYTPIDWSKLKHNQRLAGFINKASDGISPRAGCKGNKLCKVTWKRYVATRELYHTRRILARTLGMKWGAYHLARPGNPIAQAEHFLRFTKPDKDDLLALDIEHNNPRRWMSLPDAEKFAKHIKKRTGRYPVLYTNHSTAKFIAANRAKLPLLSRLNLWYARYKPNMRGAFPMGNWKTYTLWQFSSMVNCNNRSCLRRIKGAGNWIDVNVVNMSPAQLKKQWPFAELRAKKPRPDPALVAMNGIVQSTTMVVGAVVSVPTKSSFVQTASYQQPEPAPAMADIGAVATPTWRPGAVIVKRQIHKPDNQFMAALRAKSNSAYKAPSSIYQSFPVETVVFKVSKTVVEEDLSGEI
ncbi:MAG: glycoside hydrolase family 25 protein [Rhizobiaceae bacterium]